MLEVRAWRVEFAGADRGDVDWAAVFAELDAATGEEASGLPRRLPTSGSPMISGETSLIHRRIEETTTVSGPPAAPAAGRAGLSVYGIEHRDPEELHHVLKRVTGEVRDIPTHGTTTDYERELRMPVRTTVDPTSGQLVVTGGGAAPSRPQTVTVQQVQEPLSAGDFVPQAPVAIRLSHIGRVRFGVLEKALRAQGTVSKLYERETEIWEGKEALYQLPFVHGRVDGTGYTVGVELHIIVRRLEEEEWSLGVQPHVLSFERSPRTLRMVLEQSTTVRPGETVALTHILDPECARAPSMFEKKPPPSRTAILITRPGW